MKYIALIVIGAIAIAGCKKTASPLTHTQLLTTITWHLKYQSIGGILKNAPCNLSEVLTFKKDSTGNHAYSIVCDTSQAANVPFKWYIEDNAPYGSILTTILYTSDIAGKADSTTTLRLFTLNKDSLGIGGVVNGGAEYRAIYTP